VSDHLPASAADAKCDTSVSDPTGLANDILDQELRFETGEVRWLKRQVDESGATLAIVVFPCRENVYPSHSKWAPRIRKEYPLVVNAFRELSITEGIPFTELSPVFIEKAKGQQPLYYDGKFETHPTPAGYRVIAESVAQFLVEQGVVPRAKFHLEGRSTAGGEAIGSRVCRTQ